jgi:Protein of unknown function (DUF3306)
MSDPKDFLTRWSQRKLNPPAEKPALEEKAPMPAADRDAAATAPTDREFDITTLPSLESITANSDIRAFLQRGVPAALSRAALRRAWSADPAIRDFVGLSENSWDFNAPDSIPGFGSIDSADVRRIAAQLFGEPGEEATGQPSPGQPAQPQQALGSSEFESDPVPKTETAGLAESNREDDLPSPSDNDTDPSASTGNKKDDAALQHQDSNEEDDSPPPSRRHGGALPK